MFRTILNSILRGCRATISPPKVYRYHPSIERRFKAFSERFQGVWKACGYWLGLTRVARPIVRACMSDYSANRLVVCVSIVYSHMVRGAMLVCVPGDDPLKPTPVKAFSTLCANIVNVYGYSKRKGKNVLCIAKFFLTDTQHVR